EALRINFAKAAIQPRIVAHSALLDKAPSEDLRRKVRIETHHFAGVVVHAVVISCARGSWDRREQRADRKGKISTFRRLQGSPVKKEFLDACHRTVKRRESIGGIEKAIVQAIADLSFGLEIANGIERLDMRLHQVAQDLKGQQQVLFAGRE